MAVSLSSVFDEEVPAQPAGAPTGTVSLAGVFDTPPVTLTPSAAVPALPATRSAMFPNPPLPGAAPAAPYQPPRTLLDRLNAGAGVQLPPPSSLSMAAAQRAGAVPQAAIAALPPDVMPRSQRAELRGTTMDIRTPLEKILDPLEYGARTSLIGQYGRLLNAGYNLGIEGKPLEEIAPQGAGEKAVAGAASLAADLPAFMAVGGVAGPVAEAAIARLLPRMVQAGLRAGLTEAEATKAGLEYLRTAALPRAGVTAGIGATQLGGVGAAKEATRQAADITEGRAALVQGPPGEFGEPTPPELQAPGFQPTGIAKEAGMGALTGVAALGIPALIPNGVVRYLAEVGAFANLEPIVREGRPATAEELLLAGVPLAALKAATGITGRVRSALRPRNEVLPPGAAMPEAENVTPQPDMARPVLPARAAPPPVVEPPAAPPAPPVVPPPPPAAAPAPLMAPVEAVSQAQGSARPLNVSGSVAPPVRRLPARAPTTPMGEVEADLRADYGTTLVLTDPGSIKAFVMAHGGLKHDPAMAGEFRDIPVDLKRKTGMAWDDIAEQARAQGVDPMDFLNALRDMPNLRRQKRERALAAQRAMDAQLEAMPEEAGQAQAAEIHDTDVEAVKGTMAETTAEGDAALKGALDFFGQMAAEKEEEATRDTEARLPDTLGGPVAGGPEAGGRPGAPPPGPGGGVLPAQPLPDRAQALPERPPAPPEPRGPLPARPVQPGRAETGAAEQPPAVETALRPAYSRIGEEHPLARGADVPEGTVVRKLPGGPGDAHRESTGQVDLWTKVGKGDKWTATIDGKRLTLSGADVWNRYSSYLGAVHPDQGTYRYPDDGPGVWRGHREPREDLPDENVIDTTGGVVEPPPPPTPAQAAIAGLPRPAMPGRPLKPKTPQGEITETPLFGQEQAKREEELAAAQGEIGVEPALPAGWRKSETFKAPSGKVLTYYDQEFGPFRVAVASESVAELVAKPGGKIAIPPQTFSRAQAIEEADDRRDRLLAYDYKDTPPPPWWGARPETPVAPPPRLPGRSESEVVHTVTNAEDGTTAVVAKIRDGYSVSVRDDDSGQTVGTHIIYKTLEEAKRKAEEIRGPKAAPVPQPAATYATADRFTKMAELLEELIRKDELPQGAGTLRRAVARAIGLDPKAVGLDADTVDDLFDAMEVAVNRVYRARREAGADLADQIERARKAESYVVNRTKTLGVRDRQQFSTPLPLAEGAAYALDARAGETVGEPTAGTGNLLAALPPDTTVLANEMDPRRAHGLRLQGYPVTEGDALKTPMPASLMVMNPPWGKYSTDKYGKAIPMPYGDAVDLSERFVVKALRDIPDGGRVSAVMPTTILESPKFLTWLRQTHTLRALIQSPPGAYTTRGTTVDSVLLVVDKGRLADAPEEIRSTPATWEEYTEALRPLAQGGTHAREGQDPLRPATPVSRPTPAEQPAARPGARGGLPGRPARGGVGGGQAGTRALPAASADRPVPADVAGRQPEREPEGRVPPVGERPAPGRGEPGAVVVAGGGRGADVEPPGARGGLPGAPRGAAPGGEHVIEQAGERYSVANRDEFDAAVRSEVFAPAPLRSSRGAHPHPRLVVKTRSLAGAPLPPLTYQPKGKLLADAYARGVISDQQWDYGIIPALQAMDKGHGFLVAADVGVGKTRVAAGVAGELLESGAVKRLLYVTASEVNVQDVKREFDLYAGGKWPFQVLEVRSFGDSKEKASGTPDPLPAHDQAVYIIDRYNLTGFRRTLMDLGFDAIIGDEAHLYKNIQGAKVGESWLAIQKQTLQRGGKFLYLSATPAVSFSDLEHFIGLKEWHPDGFEDYVGRVTGTSTPRTSRELGEEISRLEAALARKFPEYADYQAWRDANLKEPRAFMKDEDRKDLLRENLAALEAELRARGGEAADVGSDAGEVGVTVKKKKSFLRGSDAFAVQISPAEQEQIMRELAMRGKYDSVDLWRAGVDFTIATTPLTADQKAEYARLADFMGRLDAAFSTFGKMNTQKKTFTIRQFLQQEAKRRMFDYRLGPALEAAKAALARGEQVVISTISVNEVKEDQGPIPGAIAAINAQHVEVEDGEVTVDEEIPEALVARAELLEEWSQIRQPGNPVDMMVEAFGKNQVAVITGATSPKMRERMIAEFQNGTRSVAVISGAGKTGISLHHVLEAGTGSKGRRHLIVTDYEWSATTFKQELGRVDRSGQISAPKVTVLSTGAAGEKKFLATIANRMRNLGALSKGSAESASNDQLAEFEIGGSLDTHAMRMAYRDLPPDIQEGFLAKVFRDPNTGANTRSYPQAAQLKDFLLDLQFMPVEAADQAFEAFWARRQVAIDEQAGAEIAGTGRTESHRGEILRTTELRPDLLLHEVKDAAGHRHGILQGLITDHMTQLTGFLPTSKATGATQREYVTFRAADRQIAGLRIRPGAIAGVARAFGQSLSAELRTPQAVLEALHAGDRVRLSGGEEGYTLRERPSDHRIAIEGAKMADRKSLQEHGAKYAPAGNFWWVTPEDLPRFISRFPVIQPTVSEAPTEGRSGLPGRTPTAEEASPFGEGGFFRLRRRPKKWQAPPGTGLEEIAQMNRPPVPTRSMQERMAAIRQRAIETQVNRFEALRPLTQYLEDAGATPNPGEAPIEVAELAKNRTNGQILSFALRLGAVYKEAAYTGVEDALSQFLTLTQMEKRIRDLVARNPRTMFGPGQTGVSASGYRTQQGALLPQKVNPRDFDTAKIDAELARLEADLGPDRWAQVGQLAGKVWALNREILRRSHEAGIISDEAFQSIIGKGDDYVPFQVLDYINHVGGQIENKTPTRPYSVRYQDYLRTMEGTERDVANVVEASLTKASRAIALINRNRAARAVADLAPLLPGVIEPVAGDVFQVPGDKQIMSAFINGERKNFAVPPDVFRALSFLDEGQVGIIERFLEIGKTPLQSGATSANVAFAITNLARDVKAAAYYSKFGIQNPVDFFRFPLDWAQGLASVLKQDALYHEFLNSGAAFSTMQRSITPERMIREAAGLTRFGDIGRGPTGERSAVGTLADLIHLLLKPAREINNAIEEATKVQTFLRGQRLGATPEDIAYETANYGGSPNFSRAGSWGKQLNLLWPFYNARLQGTARTYRRFRVGPRSTEQDVRAGVALRLALFVGLADLGLWLWNQQFDDDHGLDDVPDTDRNRYYVILLPETYQAGDGSTRRKYLKLAMEEGEQVIAPAINAFLSFLKGRSPESVAKLMLDMTSNLSPIGVNVQEPTPAGVAQAAGAGVVAAVNPVVRLPVELGANYNFRNQQAIVPRALAEHVMPQDAARPTTSPLMMRLSEALAEVGFQVSPIKLEYAISSGTGGLGASAVDTADYLAGKVGLTPGKTAPDHLAPWEQTGRLPFLSRFIGTGGDQENRAAEERFFRVWDQARQVQGSLKLAEDQLTMDRLSGLIQDPAALSKALFLRDLNDIGKGLAEVRKAQVFFAHRFEADAEVKQAALGVLHQQRQAILDAFRAIESATGRFTRPGMGATGEEAPAELAGVEEE